MSKRMAWILGAVAAAAVIGWIIWQRRSAAVTVVALPPPAPSQPATATTHSTSIANAFTDFVGAATNWGAQWFSTQVSGAVRGSTSRPPPISSAPVTEAKPGAVTRPVDRATYLA
jgi:hypothetical protein